MLSSTTGKINAWVGKNAAFNLNATTLVGTVKATGLTVVPKVGTKPSTKSLIGTVNGGGSLLQLKGKVSNITLSGN